MRRYWVPVALASEVAEADGPPLRVRVLGEPLVAFRDTAGRLGLVEEYCAHRCASLFLGRNEEGGLRCVYHGWKYDVAGQCVDQPTEPAVSTFKERIRLRAYPTVELGDVVWAYLGPADKQPPPPRFEWTQALPTHRHVTRTQEECNWLQALEGGIDSVHASIMHRVLRPDTTRAGTRGFIADALPFREDVYPTDYGLCYGSVRAAPDARNYIRVYHYVLPFHTFFPYQVRGGNIQMINGHMFVPMDDEHCMVYNLIYRFGDDPLSAEERDRMEWERGRGPGEITADLRKVRRIDNDWLVDRRLQKTDTYTGIEGINNQDHAIQESMGPIVDRTREHLGSTDKAIIAARRLVLGAIKTVQDGGDPLGLGPSYYGARAIDILLPEDADWWESLQGQIYPDRVLSS
jgi:phenylpropionate dioxygenase-like ring-hydroxylating dioxygenase large terminal subunit